MGPTVSDYSSVSCIFRLLRNCCLEYLARLAIEEIKAEGADALPEVPEDALLLLDVIGGGAGIAVDHVPFEDVVHEHGEFGGGRRDRFGLAYTDGQASVKGAERRGRWP